MADNPERLAQIMQRMQVSNQRTLGNRFGGGYSGASSATAPTPPSEQIDFTKNTLSPPSMAEPDDTGPGQQMPSVIQPPAPSPISMPSGGNAYLGNQPGVSPSTRDLYSLPDYSGGMRGGMGGDDRLDRLLKMLSNYMGSQMAPPSAAPTPAPIEATPPSIDQPELQKPVEYTGGSQLPAPSPAPAPSPGALPSQYKSGYAPPPVPAGIRAPDQGSMNSSVMGEMYNPNTGQRYTTTSGGYSAEPGSGWVSQGQPGYVARDYSKEPPPDLVRLGGSRVGQADEPRMSTMEYTPAQYARDQARRASGNLNELELMQKNNPEMYNSAMRIPQANDTPEQQEQSRRAQEWYSSQQRPITNDPKSPNFNPNLNAYGERGPDISLATNEFAALSPATMGNEYKSLRLASGERENKFNALSEQEKASILRNLRISTN